MNNIRSLPDFKLIRKANNIVGTHWPIGMIDEFKKNIDEELGRRFESIREELEAYEEFETLVVE